MSVKVCVYPIMRDPSNILHYGNQPGTVSKGTKSSSSLISATMAAISKQNASIICQPVVPHTTDTTSESHACTLPEILKSPSSLDTPFLLQMKKVTQKRTEESFTTNIQRNSTFPNFRALQRLALSAKTRASHANQIIRQSSFDYPPSLLQEGVSCSKTPDYYSQTVALQDVRSFQDNMEGLRSASDAEIPTGFSSLKSLPGNRLEDADKREGILHSEMLNLYPTDHSVPSKAPKRKSTKKRKKKTRAKSRGQHPKKSSQDSKQSKLNSLDNKTLEDTSLGSLLRALPVVVEPKKIEIYSSRYGKCNSDITNVRLTDMNVINRDPRLKLARKNMSQGNLASNPKTPNCDMDIGVTNISPTILGASGPVVQQQQYRVDIARTTRVFLSEKQSGTLKECGLILPCAPPGTPTPQMLQKYQYVPSMMDLRSQRAVRDRLVCLEQKAKKKQQQQREEAKKTEQQLQRDQMVAWKQRQRLEIYALNKLMTEFEEGNFLECMEMMRGKTP